MHTDRKQRKGAEACLEGVSGCSINRDVELGDRDEVADPVRELGVGDQEGGDAAPVQLCQDGIDLGVHDGLTNQGQGTVPHLQQHQHLRPMHMACPAFLAVHIAHA